MGKAMTTVRCALGAEIYGDMTGGGRGGGLGLDVRTWPALGSWMLSKQMKRKGKANVTPAQLRRAAADAADAPKTLARFLNNNNLVLNAVGEDMFKFATRPELPTIAECGEF